MGSTGLTRLPAKALTGGPRTGWMRNLGGPLPRNAWWGLSGLVAPSCRHDRAHPGLRCVPRGSARVRPVRAPSPLAPGDPEAAISAGQRANIPRMYPAVAACGQWGGTVVHLGQGVLNPC